MQTFDFAAQEKDRVYNFAAGPSMMPVSVLERAARDMVCYPGAGCSVMEMSHRTPAFEGIRNHAEATLRSLMGIPDDYAVLFLQGGATLQFSAVPMNLCRKDDLAAYAVTGNFAGKAQEEGARFCRTAIVASSADKNHTYIPKITADMVPQDAKYLHITGNNTIFGTAYTDDTLPQTGSVPLVADWSSAILGQQIDVSKYGLIYAGAQKNLGPAGLTIVIVKRSLLCPEIDNSVPPVLRYAVQDKNESMYNTPPCFAIYMAGLMFDWVTEQGGAAALEAVNRKKAGLLYDFLDSSKLFCNPVRKDSRSLMNVVFTLRDADKTPDFLAKATQAGMINIKGHRLVGGCRASLYNGMPYEGVERLVDLMARYEKENG